MYADVMHKILVLTVLVFSLLVSGPVSSAQLQANTLSYGGSEVQFDLSQQKVHIFASGVQTSVTKCVQTCNGMDFLPLGPKLQRIGLLNAQEFFMKRRDFLKRDFPSPILGPPRRSA